MLDDLKMIHERDREDTLGVAEKQWQQLEQNYDVELGPRQFKNVVLAGMGGSALAALVMQVWPGLNLPFEIVRNYDLPTYVGPETLIFASSYSGNTEETLSALAQAEAKGAFIVIMASGGQLADIAREKNYPLLLLPDGLQPRYTLFYGLKALLTATDKLGLTNKKAEELAAQAEFVKSATAGWRPDVATKDNQAKQIALEIIGKSAVIYAGPRLAPAAYKWKISFNENAKHIAWTNQYPEFNHNEFIGWTKQPVDRPYAVIELRSPLEHERVQKRFEVSGRLLSGLRPAPIVVEPKGDTLLRQLLWTVALGDFVTLYTALLNGLNPAPVDIIEKFKKSLNE
jgi:glucose/mannose-6-phosphate isomerase